MTFALKAPIFRNLNGTNIPHLPMFYHKPDSKILDTQAKKFTSVNNLKLQSY